MATLTPRTSKVGKAARGRTAFDETPLVLRGDLRLDGAAQTRARARLGRALASMAPRIERLTVRFEDVNGPRGGVDTRCRMKAVVAGAPSVVVEQSGGDPAEALARATPRLRRALRDLFDRRGGAMPAPTRPRAAVTKRRAGAETAAGPSAPNRRERTTRRMTAAMEESHGQPSRKSTRRSTNRARAANKKTRRQRARAATPRARHRKQK